MLKFICVQEAMALEAKAQFMGCHVSVYTSNPNYFRKLCAFMLLMFYLFNLLIAQTCAMLFLSLTGETQKLLRKLYEYRFFN